MSCTMLLKAQQKPTFSFQAKIMSEPNAETPIFNLTLKNISNNSLLAPINLVSVAREGIPNSNVFAEVIYLGTDTLLSSVLNCRIDLDPSILDSNSKIKKIVLMPGNEISNVGLISCYSFGRYGEYKVRFHFLYESDDPKIFTNWISFKIAG